MTSAGTPAKSWTHVRYGIQAQGACEAGAVLLVVDDAGEALGHGLEDVGGGIAVKGSVPTFRGMRQDDLVLHPGQRRLAAAGFVAQREVLHVLEQLGHSGFVERFEPRLAGFAGFIRVPDLEGPRDVAAVAAEQADRVALGHVRFLGQPPQHAAFGKQLLKEVAAFLLVHPRGHQRQWDGDRQQGAVDAERPHCARFELQVERAPVALQRADTGAVQFYGQLSHASRAI